MHNHFGIAVGIERVAASFQFTAQFRKVVNLTVEDYPNAGVFVVDRLTPARKIDNAEPTHPKSDRPARVNTLVVRPAMHDSLAHPVDITRAHLLV